MSTATRHQTIAPMTEARAWNLYGPYTIGTRYENENLLFWQIKTSFFCRMVIRGRMRQLVSVPSRSLRGKRYLLDAETLQHVAVVLPDGELLEGNRCKWSAGFHRRCNHERAAQVFVSNSITDTKARREYEARHYNAPILSERELEQYR